MGVTTLILKPGTRHRRVVNFTLQTIYLRGNKPGTHSIRSYVSLRDVPNVLEEKYLALTGIRNLGITAHSLATVEATYLFTYVLLVCLTTLSVAQPVNSDEQ
jgi:hypothetical protein